MPNLNYTAIITWTLITLVVLSMMTWLYKKVTKNEWIYTKDVEIGVYDSIKDPLDITKVGDTLIIEENTMSRDRRLILGKYKGSIPIGTPFKVNDTTYYKYYNLVVREK